MPNELKPCPFCGGKAEIRKYHHYGLGDEYFVKCTVCGMHTPGGICNKKNHEIRIWNRRAKRSLAKQEAEEIKR